jgi:hypothetical protein
MTRSDRVRRRSLWLTLPLAAALILGLGARPAHADLSKKVISTFKGKIVVTKAPVESAEDDKATVARINKDALKEVNGAQNAEDAWEWTFSYTAFLKKTGTSSLKLEFYDGGKYVADKSLSGVDPKLTVLEGDVTISEDDGLAKGKKYTIKLVGSEKGKEVVYAASPAVVMK